MSSYQIPGGGRVVSTGSRSAQLPSGHRWKDVSAGSTFKPFWAHNANWKESMKKNVSGQTAGAQMVSASDGSAFTGSVTVYITGDAGTQGIGTVGSGVCTHEGNGFHSYAPSQAETNYSHIAFTYIGTGAVPQTVQVYTTFPQTGDSFDRLGAPVGASISADVAGVQSDTNDIQTRIPAALVSGRMDASVGAMAADTLTSSALAASAVTEIQSGLSTLDAAGVRSAVGLASANLDTQLTAIDDYIDTEVAAIRAVTDKIDPMLVAGGGSPSDYRFTVEALENAPSPAQIADAVWDEAISGHLSAGTTGAALNAAGSAGDPWTTPLPGAYGAGTAGKIIGDNINATISSRASQTSVDTIDDFLDTEVAAIKAKTDNLPSDPADASDIAASFSTVNSTLSTIAAYVDTEVAAIKEVTDKINPMLVAGAGSPSDYRFTVEALENAPSGTGASAAAIADEVQTRTIAAVTVVNGLAANTVTAAALAADAVTEIQSGLATSAALSTVAGYIDTEVASILAAVDTEVAAIKAKTDNLPASPAATGDIPSAASIADAVWDEATSGHTTGGSTGAALRDADLRGSRTVIRGTVDSGASATQFTPSALDMACASVDQLKGRIIVFDRDTTTAALRGEATDITASSNASLPLLTFSSLSATPASGDTFSIV